MAFNDQIATRIRAQLKLFPETFTEKKMFGGIAFLYEGKMTIGIIKDELVVRIISEKIDLEMKNPHARPMDFTKRPMKEFAFIATEGFKTETQLLHYIELGLQHAKSKL